MSGLYPLLVDLRHTPILVVGGGAVASRKVATLVEHGGRPVVVAPTLEPALAELIHRTPLVYREREYAAGDVEGHRLVVAATDRREVNARVAREAAGSGAWVNVVDDPDASTFQVPATVRQGEVVVSLSTGGAAPLLARRLRERLERLVTPGLARTAQRLREARERVRERWPEDENRRRAFWFALITEDFLDCAIAGQDEEVESRIEACLSQS